MLEGLPKEQESPDQDPDQNEDSTQRDNHACLKDFPPGSHAHPIAQFWRNVLWRNVRDSL